MSDQFRTRSEQRVASAAGRNNCKSYVCVRAESQWSDQSRKQRSKHNSTCKGKLAETRKRRRSEHNVALWIAPVRNRNWDGREESGLQPPEKPCACDVHAARIARKAGHTDSQVRRSEKARDATFAVVRTELQAQPSYKSRKCHTQLDHTEHRNFDCASQKSAELATIGDITLATVRQWLQFRPSVLSDSCGSLRQ